MKIIEFIVGLFILSGLLLTVVIPVFTILALAICIGIALLDNK